MDIKGFRLEGESTGDGGLLLSESHIPFPPTGDDRDDVEGLDFCTLELLLLLLPLLPLLPLLLRLFAKAYILRVGERTFDAGL